MTRIDETRDFIPVRIAVLTVSDTRGLAEDRSGDTLADRLTGAMSICCSKRYVHSVCWQELMDPAEVSRSPEMPHGGLLLPNGQAKVSAARTMQLSNALREGRSPLNIKA